MDRLRALFASVLATLIFGLCTGAGLAATDSVARERIAVVIGNQDYESVIDLSNARNDATRMSSLLHELGFTVFDGYDLDRRGFEDLLRKSVLNVSDGSEIVFFYAGHGIQLGRRNYLLPTDVAFKNIYDLPTQSVTLDRVIELLSAKGTVHVAIIDACRDNPFPNVKLAADLDASLFETKAGFDVVRTPLNSLVAFSTSPGMVAFDGDGENSPYTSAILNVVSAEPQDTAQTVFAKVREEVFSKTNGKQVPWESSTLVTPFRFGGEGGGARGLMLLSQADIVKPVESSPPRQSEPETAPTKPEPITLPASVSITVAYDREMPVGEVLARALGLRSAFGLSVAEPPAKGGLRPDGNGGLVYEPVLSERRATGSQVTLEDRFTIDVENEGSTSRVGVSLRMPVNGCDLAAGDALDAGGSGFFRLPNEINVAEALTLCRKAVAEHPGEARFRYQLGRAEQAAGRFDTAFASFKAAAEAGYVRALQGEARLLSAEQINRELVSVPYDPKAANALYEKGITAGDPFAIHSLGLVLLRHGTTAAERERGFDLLDRSAELGHTYSMNELGVFFLSKDKGHHLPERGMRYLQASAARNDIYGIHNLGFVALFGLETGEPDLSAAYKYFERAAEGGHPKSPAALGRMIVRGQAKGHSIDEALDWYDIGLARGDGWGGANGATLILNGQVASPPKYEGYIRAAKTVVLPGEDSRAAARTLLESGDDRSLGMAVQGLMNELGGSLAVDGAVGPATRRAVNSMAAEYGVKPKGQSVKEMLLTAATVYWAKQPARPDLF
ncbi:caspase family protein [Aquicoccus sp. G2-2]|uniref:caspase family protein n=1 Tax=Aquicoccus sp. G2-2 TaxID=3092120 RepID=UPI003672262D